MRYIYMVVDLIIYIVGFERIQGAVVIEIRGYQESGRALSLNI